MKVVMLGAFAVGKTSLVQRFVNSIFSDKYKTTLGVKIDKKTIAIENQDVDLILWDLAGEDEFMKVRSSYLRGSSGAILVADGTRPETLDIAVELNHKVNREVGHIPFILLVNKSDLQNDWEIDRNHLQQLKDSGWVIVEASALENDNVEYAFNLLTTEMYKVAQLQNA
jgi:small GTP-binding protein